MPAAASGTVLVTGSNGFIGIWVVKYHLENGFNVKAVVRSAAKGNYLTKLFEKHGEKLQIVVIEDITVAGAFDEALKGVDVVQHIASPCYFHAQSVKEIVDTASQATKVVLDSALKVGGSQLKRVVICSSIAAVTRIILFPPEDDVPSLPVLNEKYYNQYALNQIETLGDATDGTTLYCASKTISEQLAWKFMEENKPSWDLVAINPALVFGPILQECASPEQLNETMVFFWQLIIKGANPAAVRATSGNAWCDVRNIAEAHLKASTVEEASGKRFIVAAGSFTFQEWIDAVHKADPSLPLPEDQATESKYWISVETTQAQDVLGIKYHTMEETTKDTLDDMRSKGWL